MAITFKLGKDKKDVEQEELEKIRQLEIEARNRIKERDKKIRAYNSHAKKNRRIVSVVSVIFLVFILIFGVYNTFFANTLSSKDVMTLINSSSNAFDSSGISGFIYDNIDELYEKQVQTGDETTATSYKIDKNSLRISRIDKLSLTTAVVYFGANVETTSDSSGSVTEPQQFSIVVNYKDGGYSFATPLNIRNFMIPNKSADKIEENEFFTFEGIDKYDEEQSKKAEEKVDRLLSDLYEGKPTTGDIEMKSKFKPRGNKYKKITEFIMYKKPNKLGFNATCKYDILTKEGALFSNDVMIKIEKTGSTYKITKFL